MTETKPRRPRVASIDIQDTETNRPIVDAIVEDNPDAELLYQPGMVKIRNDGGIYIKKETVEKHLGAEWETSEIQLSIISMSGNLDIEEDYIEIAWRR
ncbi:MAG TPA: monooxygenase [Propionibacterium sp.]|jgi:phenol hydroxylase P2 protein|nr:monooxygenase [Propionibacterium sp.]